MFNSFHLTLLSLNVKTDAGIQTSSVDSNPAYFDLIGQLLNRWNKSA